MVQKAARKFRFVESFRKGSSPTGVGGQNLAKKTPSVVDPTRELPEGGLVESQGHSRARGTIVTSHALESPQRGSFRGETRSFKTERRFQGNSKNNLPGRLLSSFWLVAGSTRARAPLRGAGIRKFFGIRGRTSGNLDNFLLRKTKALIRIGLMDDQIPQSPSHPLGWRTDRRKANQGAKILLGCEINRLSCG